VSHPTDRDQIEFVAADGTHWRVYEISNRPSLGAGTSLIFVSDRGFRRVQDFPANWRTLSPEELTDLSWRT
jgi:hypothetical protein